MKTYCSKCGEIPEELITSIFCPKCNTKVLVTPPETSTTTKGIWDSTRLKRSATQMYVDETTELYEANDSEMSEEGRKNLLNGKFEKTRDEKYQKLFERSTKKNADRQKALRIDAGKAALGLKTIAQGTKGRTLLTHHETGLDNLKKRRKARDIPETAPGIHRRDSISFENTTKTADEDTSDYKRSLLGNGSTIDEDKLERVMKIAVLSTHGTDNESMCNGFNTQFHTNLNKWEPKYQNAMRFEKNAQDIALEIWIKQTLNGRARPDVIVLLEGHVSDGVCNPLMIDGVVYNRTDSALQPSKADHLQNVTGWVRNGVDASVLEFSIKQVTLKSTHKTYMGVITHKVDGKSYYELVCHLPNEHCQTYNMAPNIETWYDDNKTHIATSLGISANNIINVMGDTNFNTDYDKIWSSAPSFGGYIDPTTFNKAFPASSADTKFMRQMCNGKVDWTNVLIRVHRASYLNHIPIRGGKGMEKPWGTDHPSFMSYTSIYKLTSVTDTETVTDKETVTDSVTNNE